MMEEYAKKYGRPDIDRIGLFIEMPFLGKIGKKKKKKKKVEPPPPAPVPRQILPQWPKSKCGNQDGYFQEAFVRIFNGERPKKGKKRKTVSNVITPFVPTNPGKLHSTPNDYFGCFIEEIPERFDPRKRGKLSIKKSKQPRQLLRPSPMTNPVKQGGPGYANITLGPYPEHIDEPPPKPKKKGKKDKKDKGPIYLPVYSNFAPIDYFNPNPQFDINDDPPKKATYLRPPPSKTGPGMCNAVFRPTNPAKSQGGGHHGCFTPWPEHMKEPFLSPLQILNFVKKPKRGEPPVVVIKFEQYCPPNLTLKTMQTTSVLYSTSYKITSDNWKTYSPTFVTNL